MIFISMACMACICMYVITYGIFFFNFGENSLLISIDLTLILPENFLNTIFSLIVVNYVKWT